MVRANDEGPHPPTDPCVNTASVTVSDYLADIDGDHLPRTFLSNHQLECTRPATNSLALARHIYVQ